ncbi:MAG: hypothetical protein Q8O92_10380 [Candidatus Latescibacter sp.]|nr:hypothetical protein [Candidatus Latescibacter sp.]
MSTILRKEIEIQLAELRHFIETYDKLLGNEYKGDPGDIVTIALAAILHSFYTGIEGIFKRIAKRIDETLPKGTDYHARLLEMMSKPSSQRPQVISESLSRTLKQYMDFRHMFRHAYANFLVWDRMEPLVYECKNSFHQFEAELMDFLKKIETPEQ